jgi:hypothetical protein
VFAVLLDPVHLPAIEVATCIEAEQFEFASKLENNLDLDHSNTTEAEALVPNCE